MATYGTARLWGASSLDGRPVAGRAAVGDYLGMRILPLSVVCGSIFLGATLGQSFGGSVGMFAGGMIAGVAAQFVVEMFAGSRSGPAHQGPPK